MSIVISNDNCTDVIYKGNSSDALYLGDTEYWRRKKDVHLTTGSVINTALNKDATSFVKSNTLPAASIIATDISRDTDGSIVTWYDTASKTQYWYSVSDTIYLNTDSGEMFNDCSFVIDPSIFKWDNVENMEYMFGYCKGQNLDFSSCNLQNVKKMAATFDGFNYNRKSEVFTIDLSNNDMPNLENMYSAFGHTNSLNVKLPKSTSKLTNTSYMFHISNDITIDFGQFDTSNVTTMEQMFLDFASTTKRDKFTPVLNTSSVQNFEYMFVSLGDYVKVLDLSHFDISSATNMHGFLYQSYNIESVIYGDHFIPSNEFISKCVTSNSTSSDDTFNPTSDMLQFDVDQNGESTIPFPDWSKFDGKWLLGGIFILNSSGYLAPGPVINAAIDKNATSFVYQYNNYWNYKNKTDISANGDWSVFTWYDSTSKTQYYYCANDIMTLNPDSSEMFSGCSKLTNIKFNDYNDKNADTSIVTNFQNMFNGCSTLTTISYGSKFVLPISVLDSCAVNDESNKTYMAFNQCPANKPDWTGGEWNEEGTFIVKQPI